MGKKIYPYQKKLIQINYPERIVWNLLKIINPSEDSKRNNFDNYLNRYTP